MTYADAMKYYGNDKPDIRFEMKFVELNDVVKGKGFPVYKKEGVYGDLYITYHLTLPSNLSQKEIDLFKELQKIKAG